MTTIKITDITYDTLTLYRKANTNAQKALAGYIIKSGQICNPIFGGAFALLRGIERCMMDREIYRLYPNTDYETERMIIHIAQLALDGKLNKFMLKESERINTIKCLTEPI